MRQNLIFPILSEQIFLSTKLITCINYTYMYRDILHKSSTCVDNEDPTTVPESCMVVRGSLKSKLPPTLVIKSADLRILDPIGQGLMYSIALYSCSYQPFLFSLCIESLRRLAWIQWCQHLLTRSPKIHEENPGNCIYWPYGNGLLKNPKLICLICIFNFHAQKS